MLSKTAKQQQLNRERQQMPIPLDQSFKAMKFRISTAYFFEFSLSALSTFQDKESSFTFMQRTFSIVR